MAKRDKASLYIKNVEISHEELPKVIHYEGKTDLTDKQLISVIKNRKKNAC